MAENTFDQFSLEQNLSAETPSLEEQSFEGEQVQDNPDQGPDQGAGPVGGPGPTSGPGPSTSKQQISLSQFANSFLNNTPLNGPGDGKPATPPRISDYASAFVRHSRSTDPLSSIRNSISHPISISQKEAARWDDPSKPWRPYTDMEDWYARDEGFLKTTAKGLSRLVLGTGLKTLEGIGYTGSLIFNTIDDVIHGRWDGSELISKTAENGFSQFFGSIEKDMKEQWLPTYQEASDRDKGFWWRAFHDYDFWMDDVVDGVAFMASAWIPGIALSKLGLGTRIASGLSKTRFGVSAAEAAVEGAGTAANYLAKANSVFKTSFDKYTAWAMATGSEALFEAAGVKENIYKSLTYDQYGNLRINPETGQIYTDEEKKKIAAPNVRNTFLLNAALLSGTNMVELNWLGKAIGGGTSAVGKGLARSLEGAAALGEEIAVKKGPINFFAKAYNSNIGAFVKGSVKGTVVEGFIEENGQLAIQRINETYGAAGKVSNLFNLPELFSQYGSQTIAAIKGEDPEAAMNIGIGGILGIAGGGRSEVRDRKQKQGQLNQGVSTFNNSLRSFIKFGDIFENEEVTVTDENGNETKQNRIVFDKYGVPKVDGEKLIGIAGGYSSIIGAIEESNKVNDKFKRDLLRDNAWGDFVGAHIQLGIEDGIFEKLEAVRNASAEDLAKLGFSKDSSTNAEIDRYKALTAAIIKQHKLLNSDVIFSDKKEYAMDEQSRKIYLMNLATQQAVYKSLVSEYVNDAETLKNQFYDSTVSSLSDGLVDQLNDIQHRINSQKELIANFKENNIRGTKLMIAQKVLDELLAEKGKILADNRESVANLKKDKDDFYKYEKEKRNEPGVEDQYRKKVKLVGDVKNHIRGLGLEWARFADTINGRRDFSFYVKNELLSRIAEQQTERMKEAEQQQAQEEPEEKETTKPPAKKGAAGVMSRLKKITGEEEDTEEEAPKTVKKEYKYIDDKGEEHSFFFIEGRSYTMEDEDDDKNPITRTFNIVGLTDDTVQYTEGDDKTVIEEPGEDWAKFAIEYDLKIVPIQRAAKTKTKSTEEKGKSKASRAKAAKKTTTENPRELESDIDIESDHESETFEGEKKKKPKFEVVGFNKTTGVHYLPGDVDINPYPGQARFFAFTSRMPITKGQYVLKVVPIDAVDKFKIRDETFNTSDIKVIVMKKTVKGKTVTYDYVDEFGNVIPEDKANADNLVYTHMIDMKTMSAKRVTEIYTVDPSISDADIRAQIKSHIEHQDNLRERAANGEDIYLDVERKSPGITRVEYSDAIGKNNKRLPMENPVEGRIIEEEPDWSDPRSATNPDNFIQLLVNTKDGALAPGLLAGRLIISEFSYNKVTGKPVRIEGTETRVFNRLLNDQEKKIITQALARFTELFGRQNSKTNPLTPSESNEYTIIFDYLKNVLNWSSPKEGRSADKYMWIQNGLHVGDRVYEFTKDSIEDNADEILEGQYHHVNNRTLWGNKPFQTIKFVKGKAQIDTKYNTYQEYLLAKREDGTTPPVYTSLPSLNSIHPQRSNSYLVWSDPEFTEAEPIGEIERTYPTTKEEQKKKKTEKKKQTRKTNKEEEAAERKTKWTKVDSVIKNFLEQARKSIKIYNWEIKRIVSKGKHYVTFKDPKSSKVYKTAAYDSLDEMYDERFKIKSLIYKYTGYNPKEKAARTAKKISETKQGKKTGKTFRSKGYITLGEDFQEKINNGEATATTRFHRYHEKFYKGDGVYKTEDGNKVNVVYRGRLTVKGKIVYGGIKGGESFTLTKQELAENLGYESWDDMLENADWSDLSLAKGESKGLKAVYYYEITPYDEDSVLDNPLEEEVIDEEEDEKETPKQTSKKKGPNILDKIRKLAKQKQNKKQKEEEEDVEEDDNYEILNDGDLFLRQVNDKWVIYNNAGEELESFSTRRKALQFAKEQEKEQEESKDFPIGSETKINIYASTGENAELSNFANRPFTLGYGSRIGMIDGEITLNSVEQAFQLLKYTFTGNITEEGWQPHMISSKEAMSKEDQNFNSNLAKKIQNSKSPAEIKKLGSQFKHFNQKAWDANSSRIMKEFIKASFEQNPEALKKLLATGNATLTHTQDKTKWGKEFPKLLMEVRSELSNSKAPVSSTESKRKSELEYSIKQLEDDLTSRVNDFISKGAPKAEAEKLAYNEFPKKDREALEKLKSELEALEGKQKQQPTTKKKRPQGPVFRTSIENMKKSENFKKLELFMAKNLPQFPIVKMANLIHNKHWGMFYNGAVYLYEKAGYGTGYHEAFEAVFGTYLTDQEQQELVDEFRSRKGTFKNPFTKKTKAYSEATFDDAREMMAEEFIKYVDGTQRITYQAETKIKSFLERLWDDIKSLLGMKEEAKVEMKSKINDVYKSITTGKFKDMEPIRERNLAAPVFKTAKNLTQRQTSQTLEGIKYYFFSEIFKKGASISSILEGMSNKESNKLLNDSFQTAFDRMLENLEDESNPIDEDIIENIVDAKIPLYDLFKMDLKRYGLSFEEFEQDEEKINDPLGIVDSIKVDPRKMTKQSVRILLASLPGIQYEEGEATFMVNGLNQPRLMDGDRVNTILLNELGNIVPVIEADGNRADVLDKMFEKLDTKYRNTDGTYVKDYGWIDSLKRRLKYEEMGGKKVDASTLGEDEMELRVAFIKSFSNIKTNPQKVLMGPDGLIYTINPLSNVNLDRIKYGWSNTLKERVLNGQTDIVKINTQGRMIVNLKSKDLGDLSRLLRYSNKISLDDALDILDTTLGIQFSGTDDKLQEHAADIKTNAIQILDQIVNGKVTDVADIYGTKVIAGRLNALLAIEAEYNSEENILSYLTPEGEQQYSIIPPNLLGNIINTFNSVKNHTELIKTCPWLGYFDEKGRPVLNPYQENSEILKKGGVLFNMKGERREGVELTLDVLTGMTPILDDGTSTSDLRFPERVANKIHFLLNSFSKGGNNRVINQSNINSDKATEFGIGIPTKGNSILIQIGDVIQFVESKPSQSNRVVERYVSHLKDEFSAMRFQSENPKTIQYYDRVYQLGHFKEIISSKILDKFKKEVLKEGGKYFDDGDFAVDNFIKDNKKSILSEIDSYLTNKVSETVEFLRDLDLFEETSTGKYTTNAISNDLLNEFLKKEKPTLKKGTENTLYSDSDFYNIAAMLTINEELLLTEQHKFLYGHPAMYNDLAKRASGATSTKEGFVEDRGVMSWMDKNMKREDGKNRSEETHATTKVISFKDQDVVSLFYKDIAEGTYREFVEDYGISEKEAEKRVGAKFENGKLTGYIFNDKGEHTGIIRAYMGLAESDAMAWGMPDAIRDMLFSTGKYSAKMKKQFAYEMAYEKLVRSGTIERSDGKTLTEKDPAYKSYGSEELKIAQEIYDKGDPGFVFHVLKPQYFGYAQDVSYTDDTVEDNFGITHPVFLKHAVQPKFYRHVEGSQYEALYIAAQKNQVDIIGFESGQKVGNVKTKSGDFVSIYNNNGEVNVETLKDEKGNESYNFSSELPMMRLYSKFYGIQVETSNKPKSSVVRGTQITKLIMVNFFNNGQPLNAEIKGLITDYNDTLKKLISLGKEKLIEELGLERIKDKDGKTIEYKAKDLSKLVSILRNEAQKRETPDNVVDAINVLIHSNNTQTLLYPFDTLINREKIDNILNSIVDSRVISAKMPGKLSTQVASTLYESNPRGFVYLKNGIYTDVTKTGLSTMTEEEKKSIKMTSSDLRFYKNSKGQITNMECYITWPYKEVTPEELGLKLENGIYKVPNNLVTFDKRLLDIVGFRIPTSGMNMIEGITIKGFTPATNGDMIVVPSEIVAKSGSDFDIDKLNLYMSNFFVDGVDYSSDAFKAFMVKDFVAKGKERSEAVRLFNSFSLDDFKKINRSARTEYNRVLNDAPFSLDNLDLDVKDIGILGFVKDSIQAYNASFKGKSKRLVYREQDDTTKEGLENKLISTMLKLIARPENYTNLVTPNNSETLKALAKDIVKSKVNAGTKKEQNEKSFTYLRTFIGSTSIRERYLTAKRMVGIAAVHLTFHSMAQVSGLKIRPTFKSDGVKFLLQKDKHGGFISSLPVDIKLNHHPANADGTFNIGHRTDILDRMISDLFGESLTGFVDGAKDPFVFDLNLSMDSAGTWFYLQHLGVPVEEVAYLFNQPIMDQYFAEVSKNKSNFKKANGETLSKEELYLKVVMPYYNKLFKTDLQKQIDTAKANKNPFKYYNLKNQIIEKIEEKINAVEKFDLKTMESEIKKGISKSDPVFQIAILKAYLEYDNQSRLLSNFMQAISYDNKKTKTIQENQSQVARWERSKEEGFVVNPEAILENTFLGEMKEQKEDLFNLFEQFFVTLTPDIQKLFQPLYDKINNPDFFASKEDMNYLLTKYQNFILTYILHTTSYKNSRGRDESLNSIYESMMMGKNNLAKTLLKYKKSNDAEISENLIIKELLPILSDDSGKVSNISLFRNKIDSYKTNLMIEALEDLKSYAVNTADTELSTFVDNLGKFVIIQSGVSSSYLDYKKILSTSVYSDLVKTILDNFKNSSEEIDVDDVWRTFHQNHWNDRTVVPRAPAWLKLNDDGNIAIKESSSFALNDYVVKTVLIADRSKLAKLKEQDRMDEAFDTILFEKSYLEEGPYSDKYIYQPVHKMGDGVKMFEVYKGANTESIIPSNNVGVKKLTFQNRTNKKSETKTSVEIPGLYVGGFTDKGKGTEQGDGKDKAMRKVADAAIVELANDKPSSSKTTLTQLGEPNYEKELYSEGMAEVVMLARNGQLNGRKLRQETKDAIDEAIKNGCHFVVGDFPGVDTEFIEYLLRKGASFQIYGASKTPGGRIAEQMPKLWDKVLKEAVFEAEESDDNIPDVSIEDELPKDEEESICNPKKKK